MKGPQLRARRNSLGLSQSQLAEHLSVTPNTVARWERDEMAIPPYLELALQTVERAERTLKPLGDYVREILETDNKTFKSVSDKAGRKGLNISSSAVSDIVKGKISNPSLKTIKALAAGLDRPEREILEAAGISVGSSPKEQGEVYISILESPRFTDMAANYERLTDAQKKAAEPMVAQLENWINSKLPPDKSE